MKEVNYDQLPCYEEASTYDEKPSTELNYNLDNVTKHVTRAEAKAGDPLFDLKRAKWYLEREILMLERETIDWNFDRAQLRSHKDGHNF